jgi:hypothetical protein
VRSKFEHPHPRGSLARALDRAGERHGAAAAGEISDGRDGEGGALTAGAAGVAPLRLFLRESPALPGEKPSVLVVAEERDGPVRPILPLLRQRSGDLNFETWRAVKVTKAVEWQSFFLFYFIIGVTFWARREEGAKS